MGRLGLFSKVFVVCVFVAACAGSLPEGGPSRTAVHEGVVTTVSTPQANEQLPYLLIAPTVDLAKALPGEPLAYGDLGAPLKRRAILPSVGDIILVTIFESQTGGLFTSPQTATALGGGGNFVNLPRQPVDAGGYISVPYAGAIRVAGRSVIDIQKEIERKLATRAIEPQVIVTIAEERANTVSVLGRVSQAQAIAVNNTKLRILDAIARAGGVVDGEPNVDVILQRDGRSTKVSYRRLVADAQANLPVLPGDTIDVVRNTRGVNVLGATNTNIRIPFDIDYMTLSDVVARAQGLSDTRADAQSVFVVRLEDVDVLRRNGVDVGKRTGTVPAVYQVPFGSPAGLLLAQNFKARDKDIVFVSNAASVQVRKILDLVGVLTRTASDVGGL